MHVVVIHGWQEETSELVQALAEALGTVPYEARQRLIGGGPAVVAGFAEAPAAQTLAQRLNDVGLATLIVDSDSLRADGRMTVGRVALAAADLQVITDAGAQFDIPFSSVDLILVGIGTLSVTETKTVTKRKFSIGKTLLAGGVPMTKKVSRKEGIASEERSRYFFLYAGEQPPFLFGQHLLNYEGLGAAMQLTREANFSHLLGELRRRCRSAVYDDRLINPSGQARLLGPVRNPETDLDLAAAILARTLRG